VFLWVEVENGQVHIHADVPRESPTVRGFISLLARTLEGAAPEDVARIPDEKNGFTYSEGDLVMARASAPNSAGAQWFFVAGPNASALDAQGTYVTFGKVTEGLDIGKNILALAGGGTDGQTPTRPVTVDSVTIQES